MQSYFTKSLFLSCLSLFFVSPIAFSLVEKKTVRFKLVPENQDSFGQQHDDLWLVRKKEVLE